MSERTEPLTTGEMKFRAIETVLGTVLKENCDITDRICNHKSELIKMVTSTETDALAKIKAVRLSLLKYQTPLECTSDGIKPNDTECLTSSVTSLSSSQSAEKYNIMERIVELRNTVMPYVKKHNLLLADIATVIKSSSSELDNETKVDRIMDLLM